jgi:hypothetical protein
MKNEAPLMTLEAGKLFFQVPSQLDAALEIRFGMMACAIRMNRFSLQMPLKVALHPAMPMAYAYPNQYGYLIIFTAPTNPPLAMHLKMGMEATQSHGH